MKLTNVLVVMCTVFTASLAQKTNDELRAIVQEYDTSRDRLKGEELFKELHAKWMDGGLPDDLDKMFVQMEEDGFEVSSMGSECDEDEDMEQADFGYEVSPVAAAPQPSRGFVNTLVQGIDYHVPADYCPASVADDRLPADMEEQLNSIKRDTTPYKELIKMIKNLEETGTWTQRDVDFALNSLSGRWMTLQMARPDGSPQDPAMEGYERQPKPAPASTTCGLCMTDAPMTNWSFTDPVSHGTFKGETHCKISCGDCLKHYLKSKIDSAEVMPWINCPGITSDKGKEKKCKHLIELQLIQKLLTDIQTEEGTPKYTYKLAAELLKKSLVRKQEWVPCENARCTDGFLCLGPEEDKKDIKAAKTGGKFGIQELTCQLCLTPQKVRKTLDVDTVESINNKDDDSKDGSWALSTCCNTPAFKEFGVCNVMTCGTCEMCYNFGDARKGVKGAVGYDSDHMKNLARANTGSGSLWLSSSQQGHIDTLGTAEKKAFLAKQGIAYDPTYQRGS